MGVTGLLQHLKEIQEPTTLSKYKGKTLAVDTYGWLHRGLISCAQELCTNVPTRSYITSVMKKVDMLRHFGVEPYMVFDGSPLPTKKGTEKDRASKREKASEAANNFMKKGDRKAAWKEFMKAAEVTAEMAKSVMVELDRRHVKYVVAPYEADPQMVYLEKIGAVDGILSEDSDLLVFGCNRLITKLTDYGECIEIDRANFHKIKRLDLFTPEQWRLVAILSGCDYTKGIPGVGLKTAFTLVMRLGSLDRVVASLQNDKKKVPDEFLAEAQMADLAFRFQKVFDPATRSLGTLNEYPDSLPVEMTTVEMCCGQTMEISTHVGICTGRMHPDTHRPLNSREQNLLLMKSTSVVVKRKSTLPSAQKTESLPGRSIESFFKVEKVDSAKRLDPGRKNEAKLSPISKKLKRIDSGASGSQSKFFGGTVPKPPAFVPELIAPLPKLDSSFLTGDSEVPDEFSSPVRIANVLDDLEDLAEAYLTDMDDDALDESMNNSMIRPPLVASNKSILVPQSDDEGYENEIEESPVKLTKIGMLWREKFLLGSTTLDKEVAVKIKCTDSESLGPSTPGDAIVELNLPDAKSLQRSEFNISESEEERPVSVKLLRFAFTG